MKKLYAGVLALALSALSCRYIYDIDPCPDRSHCFYLHMEAKEIAGKNKDSDMIKILSEDSWCEEYNRSLKKDISILEDYINSHK